MANAALILSKCMASSETWLNNEFYNWVKELPGVDPWYDYISSSKGNNSLWRLERNQLYRDAFRWAVFWAKPWTWTDMLDIDKKSYYIARDEHWKLLHDKDWNVLYKYHDTWEYVNWDNIWTAKERKFRFFTKTKQKMIAAPIRYNGVKSTLSWYVAYIEKNYPNLMTKTAKGWFESLRKWINRFFNDIENWQWDYARWDTIYNLFTSERWNHRYMMSKVMHWTFDKILSDKETAETQLWYNFEEVSFREFSEAAATYANMARWWNITVVDVLWRKYADKIYWARVRNLFKEDPETGKMVVSDDVQPHVLTKSYFMKLSIPQQIQQIKSALWEQAPNMSAFVNWVKIKIWYNSWWNILRWINFIWKPWVFSWLMTVWKWLTWFMPLLILNSWMFVTDLIARQNYTRLDWNRKAFLKKYNLWDWLPEQIDWYSAWIWQTFWDFARRWTKFMIDAANQGLFNIWDMLMQNAYKIRQYQMFFEAQFPWIKSLQEIDTILSKMDPDKLNEMLDAARWYSEFAVRNATTNSPVTAALARVHPTKNPLNQPMMDTFYTLWHFFSWWWYNKMLWAWTIFKQWISNIYRWEIWSTYLDQLLKNWVDAEEVHWLMVRKYLENEDFIYMLHKFHTALLIWKYLDRLTEEWADKRDETLFDDLNDMLSYLDIFSWDIAALTANPEWRIVKNMLTALIWEIENNASLWTASKASIEAGTKEVFRSLFRKLYFPQIATEYASLINANWDSEEKDYLWRLSKAVSDNVNGYLFYLKDKTENWEYTYYIPKWPNAYVNSILWKSQKSINFINEQERLRDLANLSWSLQFNSLFDSIPWNTFHNWVIYSFPFLKQWNISQIKDVEWFIDDHDKFRRTKEYQQLIEWELPSNLNDKDWEYAYNIITWRLAWSKEAIHNDTLWTEYSFEWEDWSKAYNKARQAQENLIHLLMANKIWKEEINHFSQLIEKNATTKYDEEAIRTLAYMEANTPWSSLQALAYMMNAEWYNYVYKSWIYYDKSQASQDLLKQRMYEWKIEAAKKYADYIPDVDKQYTWTQFILHYAKIHDTDIAKYIEWNWDNNSWSMKLVTPWSERDKDWNIRQNKILTQNFKAQLMVDIEWANWNPNARKLMNWFALIFDMDKYENPDWTLQSKYAAYALNQTETVLNHIDSLAIDSESKHMLKQWAFMFWDRLFPNIINDEKLMQRDDVKTIISDWTHYRYKEFKELNDIVTQAAEEELQNNEWKRSWAKRNYFNSWASKRFPWFVNRYDYMRNRSYSDNYLKYRVYNWIPRTYERNYLSRSEFNEAKFWMWWWTKLQNKKSWFWWKSQEDTIWLSSRRWKSIQFYKREDIDKPVEYRIPWRKRWVRKWSWVKPISATTWKHLTPKPKKNG